MKCLICGKEINSERFNGISLNGEKIYFCSKECIKKSEYDYSYSTDDFRHESVLIRDHYDEVLYMPTEESITTVDGYNYSDMKTASMEATYCADIENYVVESKYYIYDNYDKCFYYYPNYEKTAITTDDGLTFINAENADLAGYVYSEKEKTWTRKKKATEKMLKAYAIYNKLKKYRQELDSWIHY